ncbi:MAG: Lipoarabinomannan carrier protein LprG [Chloroflexi bacterium]|nr:Lipoarabinomannan carrier protein LprG [Chloroflexota bacterium]
MKRIGHLLIALSLLIITGCEAIVSGPTPTPTPTPIPIDIALHAGEKMLQVKSIHFIMELSGSLVYLDDPPTLALKHIEGDVVLPDRVRALVRVSSLGMVSEVGIIGLGEEQYVTNPLNQQWEELPPGQGWYFNPALLFDPEYGIASILKEGDWTFGTGEEEGEAKKYYLLQGQVPGEKLLYLTSGMITEGKIDTSIWIDKKTFYVHQIELIEVESDAENPSQWFMTLSKFDEEVDILAPPVEAPEE